MKKAENHQKEMDASMWNVSLAMTKTTTAADTTLPLAHSSDAIAMHASCSSAKPTTQQRHKWKATG